MKTRTTTPKAPAASKTVTPETSLQVSEFTVSERWVQLTATIREDHYPKFRPEAIPERAVDFLVSSCATSLSIYAADAKREGRRSVGLYDISLDACKFGYNRLGTLNITGAKKIKFRMMERKWRQFMADCEFIGHPPLAVIRGAFAARATDAGMPGHRRPPHSFAQPSNTPPKHGQSMI